MTNHTFIKNLRTPTKEKPLRILSSACLMGVTCGYDGTANGSYPSALKLLSFPTAQLFRFCPEEFSFGSPREMCDIHGGDGRDVLDGKANVLTETGLDWTAGMIAAAYKMLEYATENRVELAILMDISAACGSQVIYNGNRFGENKSYQMGMGVAAALLKRNGIEIISQRDFASLELLYQKLDNAHVVNREALDHHETSWFQKYFYENREI